MAGVAAKLFFLLSAFVAICVAVPRATEAPVCEGVICPGSYMPGNYLAANPQDPCSYCQCVWGVPVLEHCAKGLGWSVMYSQCIPTMGC